MRDFVIYTGAIWFLPMLFIAPIICTALLRIGFICYPIPPTIIIQHPIFQRILGGSFLGRYVPHLSTAPDTSPKLALLTNFFPTPFASPVSYIAFHPFLIISPNPPLLKNGSPDLQVQRVEFVVIHRCLVKHQLPKLQILVQPTHPIDQTPLYAS
ncbi:hypothetical protein QBC37DRAFT_107193 [Rhypophila decipiens]|uniref:Uncharacterized protein n=1 Tax=Rhypophila decipiens TaxID=261697 RepID=A0AAN6XU46_9PEZI|nr:hypothetical protein QBC37DRAFT_107193 [Rhypophila decipiens]